MQNSYLRIEDRNHPLLAGIVDTERIINGARRVDVKPGPGDRLKTPLTLIPSYPDLPMEMVYPRVPKTDIAEVYLRELGKSRVVYFPWDIDRAILGSPVDRSRQAAAQRGGVGGP